MIPTAIAHCKLHDREVSIWELALEPHGIVLTAKSDPLLNGMEWRPNSSRQPQSTTVNPVSIVKDSLWRRMHGTYQLYLLVHRILTRPNNIGIMPSNDEQELISIFLKVFECFFVEREFVSDGTSRRLVMVCRKKLQ